MSNDNSGSLMMAFVIGALTGAAVALLFAPASGEETRELIGQKAREGTDRLKEQRDSLLAAAERKRAAFRHGNGERV